MTRLRWFAHLAMMTLLVSCAGSNPLSYDGQAAQPDGRMAIKAGGPHEATWQNNDLVISYAYNRQTAEFDIRGRIQLQDRLDGLPSVEFLRVNIHFLDADGLILETRRLWTALGEGGLAGKDYFINWQFDHTFFLPQPTRSMTFSYRGRVVDRSSNDNRSTGDGASIDFWRTP